MGIIARIVDRIDPADPADLTVRRVGRFGRIEVTGLPAHLRGRPRRQPDALDLAICAAADRAGANLQHIQTTHGDAHATVASHDDNWTKETTMHIDDEPRRFRPISSRNFTPMPAPVEVREQIEAIAASSPDWGPKRIEAALRREGHNVPIDMIRTVLAD